MSTPEFIEVKPSSTSQGEVYLINTMCIVMIRPGNGGVASPGAVVSYEVGSEEYHDLRTKHSYLDLKAMLLPFTPDTSALEYQQAAFDYYMNPKDYR